MSNVSYRCKGSSLISVKRNASLKSVLCCTNIIGKGVHVLSSMVHRVYVFGKLNVKTYVSASFRSDILKLIKPCLCVMDVDTIAYMYF